MNSSSNTTEHQFRFKPGRDCLSASDCGGGQSRLCSLAGAPLEAASPDVPVTRAGPSVWARRYGTSCTLSPSGISWPIDGENRIFAVDIPSDLQSAVCDELECMLSSDFSHLFGFGAGALDRREPWGTLFGFCP